MLINLLQSILKRVTSRVSQWFSPSATSPNSSEQAATQTNSDEEAVRGDYNGHLLRRRCSQMISPAEADRAEEVLAQPPLKRSKTGILEVFIDILIFY